MDYSATWQQLKPKIEKHYLEILPKKLHTVFKQNLNLQQLITIEYWGFDGKVHVGQLICNQQVEKELIAIFQELFTLQFPIQSIIPISEFGFDDNQSMQANNSTCFDFRMKTLGNGISKHAKGLAIDINPMQNPFVTSKKTYPTINQAHITNGRLRKNDLLGKKVIEIFKKHGWTWGGNWKNSKDYMHFEKTIQ